MPPKLREATNASGSAPPREVRYVGGLTPEQCHWVIQPLLAAGLALDQVRDHLFHLAFDAVVTEGRSTAAAVTSLVGDQPAHLRAAWVEVVHRMITLHAPAG